jgi:hypothetical protein
MTRTRCSSSERSFCLRVLHQCLVGSSKQIAVVSEGEIAQSSAAIHGGRKNLASISGEYQGRSGVISRVMQPLKNAAQQVSFNASVRTRDSACHLLAYMRTLLN